MQVRYFPRNFKLSRTSKERSHLIKSLSTHLVMNDKIRTTYAKARYLKQSIDYLISKTKYYLKNNKPKGLPRYLGFLETRQAKIRLQTIVSERFLDTNIPYTKITRLPPRKGDCSKMAYIEINLNPIQLYQKEILL